MVARYQADLSVLFVLQTSAAAQIVFWFFRFYFLYFCLSYSYERCLVCVLVGGEPVFGATFCFVCRLILVLPVASGGRELVAYQCCLRLGVFCFFPSEVFPCCSRCIFGVSVLFSFSYSFFLCVSFLFVSFQCTWVSGERMICCACRVQCVLHIKSFFLRWHGIALSNPFTSLRCTSYYLCGSFVTTAVSRMKNQRGHGVRCKSMSRKNGLM